MESQPGTLSPLPAGSNFTPGELQFNVVVPASLTAGDQRIVATDNEMTTQIGTLITVQ